MKELGIGSAPGKVILSGEHSVVYGYPALVNAISLRCRVQAEPKDENAYVIDAPDLNLRITYDRDQLNLLQKNPINKQTDNLAWTMQIAEKFLKEKYSIDSVEGYSVTVNSEIPISSGLGSSAATAVALVASLFDLYGIPIDPSIVSSIAFEGEKIAHGTPSGVDNAASSFGGFIWFQDRKITPLDDRLEFPLIICNTNVPRETKKLVLEVRRRVEQYPKEMNELLRKMGEMPSKFLSAIRTGQLVQLGLLMNENQELLDSIGVNHPTIEKVRQRSLDAGALGAKLTGAGGGGCVIILPESQELGDEIQKVLIKEGWDAYSTQITFKGVVAGQ